MIIKKIIIYMLLLALVSCSRPSVETDDTHAEPGAGELTVWTWRKNYNGRALEIALEHFLHSNPGVKLNIVDMGRDEILSRLKIHFTIKDYEGLPDIVLIEDYQIQEILRKFPGEIRALSPVLDKSKYAGFAVMAESLDDIMYGVPLDAGSAVMFYRADYIESAGYGQADMEDLTWEKYIEIGVAVKEKTGKYMLSLTPNDLWQIRLMLQSAGQWYVKEDGITVNLAGNPVLKDAINTYIDIVKSGIALHVPGYDGEYRAAGEGSVATVLTGTWRLQIMASQPDAQEMNWAIAPIPRMSGHGSVNASALGGYGWYVIDKAGNADLAVDFLLSTLVSDMDLIDELAGELTLISPVKSAGTLPGYLKPISNFRDQPALNYLFDMMKDVPAVNYGMHTYPIDRLIENSVQLIMQGAGIDDTLRNMQIIAEAIP